MTTSSHSQACRCGLHAQSTLSRHECYRHLAHAILGPVAPKEDLALARALAEHANLPFNNVIQIRPRRVA